MGIVVVNEHAPLIRNGRVELTSDMLDIGRRIREGDELWRGDPSMTLCWNPLTQKYEVIGVDRTGQQYLAASHHACDARLLIKLSEGDPTKHNVLARVMKENEQLRAAEDAAAREKAREVADKMHFALRKDLGQHMGGRHRQYGMYDGKGS